MCVIASCTPRARSAAGPDVEDRRVARLVERARQHDGPLHPRVAQDLERRGQVVGDRRPQRVPGDGGAVEGVLVSGEELLEHRGGVGARGHRLDPRAQRVAVVEPVRRLSPGARRRLRDEREADLLGEPHGLRGAAGELMAGARDPGGSQHRLHPGLVADVAGGLDVHPVDAEALADLGQRHLELLERPDDPLHPADLAAQPGHRLGDLARVEGVVDPPVAGELLVQHGWKVRRGGVRDEPEPYARQARRRRDEPRRGVEEVGRDEDGGDHDTRRYRGPSMSGTDGRGAGVLRRAVRRPHSHVLP
jgi:hypothetical protein